MKLLKNRIEAGKLLAQKLLMYKNNSDIIILALPRGGVPVAYEISIALKVPMDLIIVRKIGFPEHEEYAAGAIAINNISYMNLETENVINSNSVKDKMQKIIEHEQGELIRRNKIYRQSRPMPDLKGKTIILVDDGIATGSSIKAAIIALKDMNPKSIIIAVPILPISSLNEIKSLVQEVVYLFTPEPFLAVGLWYKEFSQVNDAEVIRLLNTIRK